MADPVAPAQADRRSIWGTVALAAAAVSVIAFVAVLVAVLANLEGFEEDEDSVAGTVLWFAFSIGAVLALITGVIAFVLGRRGRRAADQRAGKLAVAWFVLALLAVVIINLLD